jgi:hypothetical protein
MPAWLITIILDFVLKLGIPALIAWLKKIFGLGAGSETVKILEDYVEESRVNRRAARRRARERLADCHGEECTTK